MNKFFFFIFCSISFIWHEAFAQEYQILMNDVRPEMTTQDYWLKFSSHPDRVIMSESEISSFYGMSDEKYESYLISEKNDAEYLKNLILQNAAFVKTYDKNGTPIDSSLWFASYDNLNVGNISESIRYAVVCSNCELRSIPTFERRYQDSDNNLFDDLIFTRLLINEPVIVLHTSSDNRWHFVIGKYSFCSGWVYKDNIAFCCDKSCWLKAQSGDFLLVTANRTRLQINEPDSDTITELTMGTKLNLISPDSVVADSVNRLGRNVYAVSFPVRDDKGLLQYRQEFIPARNDVHVGYLPYTERNILNLAFSCLGDRYGWGGMFGARDCSSFFQDIYKCFGIILPRNSRAQASYKGKTIEMETMSPEQKIKVLKKNARPGAQLFFPGHVMMYLGVRDDKVFVINASSSICINGKKNYVQSVMVNTMDEKRISGKTWLESLTKCVLFQN